MGTIIQTIVWCYKIAPGETKANLYGEADQTSGKFYYPPVEITALIDRADISTAEAEFGPDRDQTVVFKFREDMLKLTDFFPQVGDLVLFNERYHECDNITQEQFRGGVSDKSLSIIVNTHYTRFDKVNIIDRNS